MAGGTSVFLLYWKIVTNGLTAGQQDAVNDDLLIKGVIDENFILSMEHIGISKSLIANKRRVKKMAFPF